MKKYILLTFLLICYISCMAQQKLWVGQKYTCESTHAGTAVLVKDVRWTVTPENLLTVKGSGLYREVTPAAYFSGTVTVKMTCQYSFGYGSRYMTGTETWIISCESNPLKIGNTSMTLSKGGSGYIVPSLTYSNSYSSSVRYSYTGYNPSVISVSSDGKVTALSPGTTTITVSSTHSSNQCTCQVTVKDDVITLANIVSSATCSYGGTTRLTVDTYPTSVPVTSISWYSSNTSIATVNSSGIVTGHNPGSCYIYCKVNGTVVSNQCLLTVLQPSFVLTNTSPANYATNISTRIQPSLTFSLDLYKGSNFGDIELREKDKGTCVDGVVVINGKSLVFKPNKELKSSTDYVLHVPSNAVMNQWNTGYSKEIDVTFRTERLKGDVDCDGTVGSTDVEKIRDCILNRHCELDVEAMDINGDGKISIIDLVLLINMIDE